MKATRPIFTPSAPKPAKSMTVAALSLAITDVNKITAAKSVGGGTIKVFMSGDTNYYVSAGNNALFSLLAKHGIENI